MSSSLEKSEVLPGEELAGMEEFLPGDGVYVDHERGVLRAAVPGSLVVDYSRRVIEVRPRKRPGLVGRGSEVAGLVTGVRHDLVVVNIYGAVRLSPKPSWLYELESPMSGAIPISQVADEYVKNIDDYYRLGDWIVARIVSKSPPYTLTTMEPRYGVIYSICGRCGALLEYQSERSMKCPVCGSVERRKVSIHAKGRAVKIRLVRNMIEYRYPW